MSAKRFLVGGLLIALLLVPVAASADGDFDLPVSTTLNCNQVDFEVDLTGGEAPYTLYFVFGDEETYSATDVAGGSLVIQHFYPSQGSFEWMLTVEDAAGSFGEAEGSVDIEGPEVSISTYPVDPPVLPLVGGQASVDFTAVVNGDPTTYDFAWEIENDGGLDGSSTGQFASMLYTSGGEYNAMVTVTDHTCYLTESAKVTVVVIDPEEEPEKACHPTALKIAEAVSGIFPLQAEQTYTCEDILQIFNYGTDTYEGQIGFGRLWHAYQLTQVIEELTWEQIRDWHLDGFGWGTLLQLDRFAEALDELDVLNLMERVLNGDNTIGDIRTAVRAVTRYDADFDDALTRLGEGATNGDLNQFYRLTNDLEVDPAELDAWLAEGLAVNELRHVAKLAERIDASWEEVADVRTQDFSWGEIGQAYRLADEELTVDEILTLGIKTVREMDRDQSREERDERSAERLAEQFDGADAAELMSLYNGECEGKWSCVRKHLREQERTETQSDGYSQQDLRKAQQMADKYGVSVDQVMAQYENCGGNWGCVQAAFRGEKGKGKNK